MYQRIRATSQNTGFIRALSLTIDEADLADLASHCDCLLDVLLRYAKFLEAASPQPEVPETKVGDDQFRRLVCSVTEITQGKTIVMLGGKSRLQVARYDSDTGDKFAKFASKTSKADIALLLKNFASHEIFYGSKDAMAADGKHFAVLPSGYRVRQVVFQPGEHAAREHGTRTRFTKGN